MTNALFVCSRNRLRSPTAEQLFAAWPGLRTASAGIPDEFDFMAPSLVALLRQRVPRHLPQAPGQPEANALQQEASA